MADFIELGKQCELCKADNWIVKDIPGYYQEICISCGNVNEINKTNYLDEFQCPRCNCLEGILEENKKLIAVRCKNCGEQSIVLEKCTTVDHRIGTADENMISSRDTKKCPKCGGTQFTPVRKKYSLLTGFLTNKVDLICNKCGAKVK